MRETPRIANGKVPLVVHLLAPNKRPVQTTTDLAGFWQRLYPQVCGESWAAAIRSMPGRRIRTSRRVRSMTEDCMRRAIVCSCFCSGFRSAMSRPPWSSTCARIYDPIRARIASGTQS